MQQSQRHPHRLRPEEGRDAESGAQQALPVHRPPDLFQHQQRGTGQRPTADAEPQGTHRVLRQAPSRNHRAPHAVRTEKSTGTRPHPRRFDHCCE